uniref:Glycosyl transferase n=2 Tax=Noccaea caerulescens TaxID=107243 RepID=A0A1J3IDC4_NOCCA
MSIRQAPILIVVFFILTAGVRIATADEPVPAPWPHQFHALLFMNYSGDLSMIDLWYDWTNGRNFNIIQEQLGGITYDLEWNNGTSFVYTLDESKTCRSAQLEVGILRPNWLDGAKYLGQQHVNGFHCNVWEKVDFIWYYEDVETKRPVQWIFYTGREAHVMTFEVGAVLEDEKWQAPVYCFHKEKEGLSIDGGGLREFKGYKEKAVL